MRCRHTRRAVSPRTHAVCAASQEKQSNQALARGDALARFTREASHTFNEALIAVTSNPSPIEEVAQTILRYITAHPDACDSLEGICDWWLTRQRRDDARSDVAAAIERLVARGRIEASSGVDGLTVYRASKAGSLH